MCHHISNAVYRNRFLPAVIDILVTCKVNSLNSVARGDIRSEKKGANPLPDKGDVEHRSSLETFELFIDGDIYYVTNSFCKNLLRIATP